MKIPSFRSANLVRPLYYFFFLPFLLLPFGEAGFKQEQMAYPRVRKAYSEKKESMRGVLEAHGIDRERLRVHLRAYKKERTLELWGKNERDSAYRKLKSYDLCAMSGDLGPKRRQGDRQIPEGFYSIDRFNPSSKYYLSLGLNYPNPSDRKLGVSHDLGGNIFIHGDCVTIGCIPITDDKIKELYIFCVEARDKGQRTIRVRIFPTRLNDLSYRTLLYEHEGEDPPKGLWKDLKRADESFKRTGVPPKVTFRENGRHRIETDDTSSFDPRP